jgi:hypothetical protein
MRKTFIETHEFTEWVREYLTDDSIAELQRELLSEPDKGPVMAGCGGLRKVRIADPRRGKGKRGGIRVIHLHVAEADVIFLMDVYGKDEQADLSPGQKKALKALAERYRLAVVQAARALEKGKP